VSAVERAARAGYDASRDAAETEAWDDLPEWGRETLRAFTRAALAAAGPLVTPEHDVPTIRQAVRAIPEVERTVVTSFQVDRASVLRDAADTVLREVARVWPGHRWPLAREVAEYAAEVLRAEAREASS